MPTLGIFQSPAYPVQAAWASAFTAKGWTVKDMTGVDPNTVLVGQVDVAAFLGLGGGDTRAATMWARGFSLLTTGTGNTNVSVPLIGSTNFEWLEVTTDTVVVGSIPSPLIQGWTQTPWAASSAVIAVILGTATGVDVLATELGNGQPVLLLEQNGQPFWLHYNNGLPPPAILASDAASYATTQLFPSGGGTGGTTACTVNADCPAGQVCQGGVCVVASPLPGGGSCTLFGIPCWLAALLGLGAIYLLSGGGKGERHGGGHRVAHHAARIRTVVREKRVVVHRRPTLHEASERLIRRRRELHR